MTSAYGSCTTSTTLTGKRYSLALPYLPIYGSLRDGTQICLDFPHTQSDTKTVQNLFNQCILDGTSWPFSEPLDEDTFLQYFFAHTVIVARTQSTGEILGAFYVKPNYPGRCSHYCNGGFITDVQWRRKGLATIMARTYLRIAKDLGFKASLFNLVFVTNDASVKLWQKLGFKKIALLPKVARLKDSKVLTDAYQFYYDLDALTQLDISQHMLHFAAQTGDVNKQKSDQEEVEIRAVHVNVEGDTNQNGSIKNDHPRQPQIGNGSCSHGDDETQPLINTHSSPDEHEQGGSLFNFRNFRLSSIPGTFMLLIAGVSLFLVGRASADLNSISSSSSLSQSSTSSSSVSTSKI